ncbi:uncharacterized protein LOC134214626 [Armigeres subalbatus]|uniref:uncharacterized protein LOC134214626 n=1 Tax=Armigeres subalbatus TaxID=124917 RepID=UPI002ED23A36
MSEGRYVRLNRFNGGSSEEEECATTECLEVGRFVRAPVVHDVDSEYEDQNDGDQQYDPHRIETDTNYENNALKKQVADMEKKIADLSAEVKSSRERDISRNDAEESWNSFRNGRSSQAEGHIPSIRWDQMKPFPKNVAANKMWEEWSKYIENFEIAASLSNAIDPTRRSQLLFIRWARKCRESFVLLN